MSLANARSEISPHPGKDSVTVATDKKLQAIDVDRKMRLYGVIEAFRNGKMPNNQQIDETLAFVGTHSFIDINALSPDGRKLIADSRDIIETARLLIKNKNADELFQNFVFDTAGTDFKKAAIDPNAATPITKEEAKDHGRQAVENLRTLLTMVLTNSEARKLLSDASIIGRDLFARGAMKAAEKARPTDEQLRLVDDAAPPDQFETSPSQNTYGTDNAGVSKDPNTGVQQAGLAGATVTHDPNTSSVGVERSDGRTQSGAQVVDEAQDAARAHAQETANAVSGDTNPDGTKRTLKDRIKAGYSSVTERIPDEHKDRARDHVERTKNFLREEFPEERRDQYIYRLKKVIVECQKHEDYTQALTWFIDTFESYLAHGKHFTQHSSGQASEIKEDPSLQRAITELRTFLERSANGKSLDGIEQSIRVLYDDAQQDQDLRRWFKDLDEYVRKTLLEPGYVLSPQCNNRGNELIDKGHAFFHEKYKGHLDNLFDSVSQWFNAWADDPLNQRFSSDWKRLTKDLLFDANGNLTFKPHLWDDIRRVILPAIIENIGYVPIPRIEYTDHVLDLVIENLTLQGQNLFPNIISMDAHNFFQFSPYNAIPDKGHHDFTFTLSQVQADMRDVAFYFNKKNGFPKIKDSGLADVVLGGEGLTATVHVASAGRDRSSVFHVKDVHVKLDSLKFSVRDSKHDLLYKTIRPLATGLVKKQVAKAVSDAITTALEYLDEQLVQVRDRMAEAKGNDQMSRQQVLKEMFERRKEEASEKKTEKTSDSRFQIVSKRDSELLPNAGYEGGLINKQAEREAAAKEGTGWHSKAFSIINPQTATNVQPHTDASRV
jgi:gas vesicle protein